MGPKKTSFLRLICPPASTYSHRLAQRTPDPPHQRRHLPHPERAKARGWKRRTPPAFPAASTKQRERERQSTVPLASRKVWLQTVARAHRKAHTLPQTAFVLKGLLDSGSFLLTQKSFTTLGATRAQSLSHPRGLSHSLFKKKSRAQPVHTCVFRGCIFTGLAACVCG